jgi:hypothetical protein
MQPRRAFPRSVPAKGMAIGEAATDLAFFVVTFTDGQRHPGPSGR